MEDRLWSSSDPCEWDKWTEMYSERILSLDKRRSGLADLDEYFFNKLPSNIRGREVPHITRDELVKIVEWKLKRKGFRPKLLDLARSNDENVVIEATTRAMGKLREKGERGADNGGSGGNDSEGGHDDGDDGSIEEQPVDQEREALQCLCELRGVGPATASAILCAFDDDFPFMSEVAMETVFGSRKVGYTIDRYMELLGIFREKAEQLNRTSQEKWTANSIERALFSWKMEKGGQRRKRKQSG